MKLLQIYTSHTCFNAYTTATDVEGHLKETSSVEILPDEFFEPYQYRDRSELGFVSLRATWIGNIGKIQL